MEEQITDTENQINVAEEKPKMRLYDFEYGFIPQLVEWYQTDQVTDWAFLDINWMKAHLLSCGYQDFEFDFNDFSRKLAIIDNKHIMVLYTFPKPYRSPLAKYGAIFLQKRRKTDARYYTLERSDDYVNKTGKINWILGSMYADGTHINFGYVEECQTVDDFKDFIAKERYFKAWAISHPPKYNESEEKSKPEEKKISWIKRLFKRN